jgi:hypothetical protein
MRKALTAMAVLIAALAIAVGGVVLNNISQGNTITQQQKEIHRLMGKVTTDDNVLGGRISSLQSSVNNLNEPTDPLSSYDDICNQEMTNNDTGVSQTYYFPCTNNAQTIPQPGN